jgi:hypothetical protein
MNGKSYSQSELEYICKYYGFLTAKEIAAELGRTQKAIVNIIVKLRENGQFEYYRTANQYWTEKIDHRLVPKPGLKGITFRNGRWVALTHYGKAFYLGDFGEVEETEVIEHFKELEANEGA